MTYHFIDVFLAICLALHGFAHIFNKYELCFLSLSHCIVQDTCFHLVLNMKNEFEH